MTKSYFMALFIFLLSFHIQGSAAGFEMSYQNRGRIIDTIRCAGNPRISYALYLPSSYTDKVTWPIIFVFDPAARGRLGVTGFVQAAEKLGFIIVGSNNSRNSLPWDELSEALNLTFTDVETRFSIDTRRIFTSGFSGGSRVAALVAFQNKSVSGVIGCGAGFPNNDDFKNMPHFSYYGLVGNRDMNWLEMCDLEKKLDSLGRIVELRVFSGGHNWPSPALLQKAVEWLELQSMNMGTMSKMPAFINARFEEYSNNASFLLRHGNLPEAVQCYEHIIRDFPDLPASTRLKGTLDSLKKSTAYNRSVKNVKKKRSWEMENQRSLISALENQVREESLPDSVRSWISGQVRMLRNLEKSKDTNDQFISARVLMLFNAICSETGRNYLKLKRYRAASICYQIESVIEPENNYIQFLLAKAYALDDEMNNALRSLENAVRLGYSNRQSVETEPAFFPFKNEKRFKEILLQLKLLN